MPPHVWQFLKLNELPNIWRYYAGWPEDLTRIGWFHVSLITLLDHNLKAQVLDQMVFDIVSESYLSRDHMFNPP